MRKCGPGTEMRKKAPRPADRFAAARQMGCLLFIA